MNRHSSINMYSKFADKQSDFADTCSEGGSQTANQPYNQGPAVAHARSVHRISPGNWLWPRNRPFWMGAGNDLNHQIIESSNNWIIRSFSTFFWHFSWLCTLLETPKLGIGHVNGLEDFRWFNSFSRHHSKWPISRPKWISGTYPDHTSGVRYRTTYG